VGAQHQSSLPSAANQLLHSSLPNTSSDNNNQIKYLNVFILCIVNYMTGLSDTASISLSSGMFVGVFSPAYPRF